MNCGTIMTPELWHL